MATAILFDLAFDTKRGNKLVSVNRGLNIYKRTLHRNTSTNERLRPLNRSNQSSRSIDLFWCELKLAVDKSVVIPPRQRPQVPVRKRRTKAEHSNTGYRFHAAVNKRFNSTKRFAMRQLSAVTRARRITRYRCFGYKLVCDVYAFKYGITISELASIGD